MKFTILLLTLVVLLVVGGSEAKLKLNAEIPTTTPPHTTGDPCNPDECIVEGYCLKYWYCERETNDHKGKGKNGTWINDKCDDEAGEHNLYWNPDHNGGAGACDFWENLSDAIKNTYNNDTQCIDPHCEWKPDPDSPCSHKYWYFHPEKNNGKDIALECPQRPDGERLLWDQSKKSCHPCGSIVKDSSTGERCC